MRLRLLRKDLHGRLPKLGMTESEVNPLVQARFYDPFSSRAWYAIEFDGEGWFFGYSTDGKGELRYFSLTEFSGLPWPHQVRRDRKFKPCRLLDLPEY